MRRDERTSNSVSSSAGPASGTFALLSDADRELLRWHLAVASQEVFPESECIGQTSQQNFYFRELLEHLLLNFAESLSPMTGGNLTEVWAFTRSATPKWRALPGAKKGRVGYARKSIKTLVHAWKRAVSSRPRICRTRGSIEFVLKAPDENCDDVILFATINDFPLVDGRPFSVDIRELTADTRLATPASDCADFKAERDRLLSRAARIVRDVEKKYLERLHNAPLEVIAAEVETLERDKKRRDYRRLAAAIVVVLGAGMAAYKILSVSRFVPVFDVGRGHRHEVANVVTDRKGHVALAEDGKAASPWADRIVDEHGHGVMPLPKKPGWVQVYADEIKLQSKIPERWEQDDAAVLPAEGSCFRMQNGDGDGAIVGFSALYDLRSIAPALNADDVTLAAEFGDLPTAVTVYKPDDVVCVNSDCSRIRLWMIHGYERNGQYEVRLVVFRDPDGWKNDTPVDFLPLARLTIRNGDLAAVEPVDGNKFEIATLPDELKLRPIATATH
jgi:catechol 2,3-dioxygenase-like lactoylglutathione lyase family enzyme